MKFLNQAIAIHCLYDVNSQNLGCNASSIIESNYESKSAYRNQRNCSRFNEVFSFYELAVSSLVTSYESLRYQFTLGFLSRNPLAITLTHSLGIMSNPLSLHSNPESS